MMKREPTRLDRLLALLDEAVTGEDIIVALVTLTVIIIVFATA